METYLIAHDHEIRQLTLRVPDLFLEILDRGGHV
jgi:hypothetical protein